MASVSRSDIRRYWFGVEDSDVVANTVLLMERDRLEQFKAALDFTLHRFQGVFNGITGILNNKRISIVYSIGPAHVADCVSFLVQGFGVEQFISTGSIGGLATEIGDVVISNSCATQDGYACAVFPAELQRNADIGSYVEIKMPQSLVVSEGLRAKVKQAFHCDIKHGTLFTLPAVSLESDDRLNAIRAAGYIALDLETGPFLAACRYNNVAGFCVHWVTDLPLERGFCYQYSGIPAIIAQDKEKKHRQWLNMPRLILPIMKEILAS